MHSSWNAHVTNEDVCKQARERNEEWQEQGVFYFGCFMDVNQDICLELGKKTILKTRKIISCWHKAFEKWDEAEFTAFIITFKVEYAHILEMIIYLNCN